VASSSARRYAARAFRCAGHRDRTRTGISEKEEAHLLHGFARPSLLPGCYANITPLCKSWPAAKSAAKDVPLWGGLFTEVNEESGRLAESLHSR
jgi:hypothetical protein